MHAVVLDEPYEFIPPYQGTWWPWLLQKLAPRNLRNVYGIDSCKIEGIESLTNSIAAGHSVLLAPNHCRPSDPLVLTELCRQAQTQAFTMASWHVFMQSRLERFLLRRIGGFSVYREGLDRQSLDAGIEILQQAKRPLIVFPEGVITRSNDRLVSLMEGVSFMARAAAKKRAKESPAGKVVIIPVALRYRFHGDIDIAVNETLDDIETRLSWRPDRSRTPVDRIYRVGETLLWLKETEFFGSPQTGTLHDRLQKLIDRILAPMEKEWRDGKTEDTAVARVKQLRTAILPDMVENRVTDEERERRWDQLADMYLAQQLGHYPPEYIRSNATPERMLETVERFEEDLTDECRVHRPMAVTAKLGTPIEVSPKRVRGVSEDPTMAELDRQLHGLLEIPYRRGATEEKSNPSEESESVTGSVESSATESSDAS